MINTCFIFIHTNIPLEYGRIGSLGFPFDCEFGLNGLMGQDDLH